MPAARVAGVDLGWRKLESGGMRVAMVVGSDNQRHELVVPLAVHQRQGKSDDLRSIRDKRRDEMKKKIASWRETVTDEWFLAETAYAAQWLKIGRIASLHYQWRARRAEGHHFDGEIPIVEELSSWMKQDRHLIRWERFGVKKMRQQITKLYEQFAHTLCKQYGRIALEDMDLVTVRKRLVDSDESWMGDIANKRGSLLSLGELRETLRYTAAKYGTEIVDVNPAYTTQQCTSCDHVGELADAAAILSTCPKCGATQDQDIRAAINILKRSDELAAGEGQRQAKDLKLRARRTRKAAKPPATVTQGDTP
jgi:IS605 OrfB family transposase